MKKDLTNPNQKIELVVNKELKTDNISLITYQMYFDLINENKRLQIENENLAMSYELLMDEITQ